MWHEKLPNSMRNVINTYWMNSVNIRRNVFILFSSLLKLSSGDTSVYFLCICQFTVDVFCVCRYVDVFVWNLSVFFAAHLLWHWGWFGVLSIHMCFLNLQRATQLPQPQLSIVFCCMWENLLRIQLIYFVQKPGAQWQKKSLKEAFIALNIKVMFSYVKYLDI